MADTYQAQANELSQKLWAIANELRGNMDASKFKNYILGTIFYRYLSERTVQYMEDLLKNAETNDEIKDGAMYPFADIGKVKDIFLVRYGDEGYRTLICLMDDGTLAAMSAKELIEDRIAVVMPNMTGRDNYVSVEQTEDDGYYGVIGITEDEKEVELDFSLDF